MGEKFDKSKENGPHKHLSRLVGNWEGTARVWFEPDKVQDESPVKGSMRLILDGRFILHEYQGSFGGKPLQGMAMIGYHLGLQRYQMAWVDSFHNDTAMMFSEGLRNTTDFKMLGSYAYVAPGIEQHWGWRTEVEVVSDEKVIFTAYNISPEGEEQKATEIAYNRVK